MPFPIIWGIPQETSKEELSKLRRIIVVGLEKSMSVPKKWIRPFFPRDLLDDPVEDSDGGNTIYVSLDTAMFYGKSETDTLVKAVVQLLALQVWNFFSGKYEVECFVGNLNPEWKCLIKALE